MLYLRKSLKTNASSTSTYPEEIVDSLYRSVPELIRSFLTIVKPPVKNFSLIESNSEREEMRQSDIFTRCVPGVLGRY